MRKSLSWLSTMDKYILLVMYTPFFPHWRARLAAFGRRAHSLRQKPILHLEKLFDPLLPPGLLSSADAGPNSRERLYSLRCTFWAFLWQVLNPGPPAARSFVNSRRCSCLAGGTTMDEGTSAYCQGPPPGCPWPFCNASARWRPTTRKKLLPAQVSFVARVAAQAAGWFHLEYARPRLKTKPLIPNRPARRRAAAFRSLK